MKRVLQVGFVVAMSTAFMAVGSVPVAVTAGAFVPAAAKAVTGTFVGAAEDSDAYVAVVAAKPEAKPKKRDVLAYVCDGASIAEWFSGTVKGNTFTLASEGGAKLTVKLTKAEAEGTFRAADSGAKLVYTAARGRKPAGLYRAKETLADLSYLAGVIVLPDGTQRGARSVIRVQTQSPGTTSSPPPSASTRAASIEPITSDIVENPTITVPGGALTLEAVD